MTPAAILAVWLLSMVSLAVFLLVLRTFAAESEAQRLAKLLVAERAKTKAAMARIADSDAIMDVFGVSEAMPRRAATQPPAKSAASRDAGLRLVYSAARAHGSHALNGKGKL